MSDSMNEDINIQSELNSDWQLKLEAGDNTEDHINDGVNDHIIDKNEEKVDEETKVEGFRTSLRCWSRRGLRAESLEFMIHKEKTKHNSFAKSFASVILSGSLTSSSILSTFHRHPLPLGSMFIPLSPRPFPFPPFPRIQAYSCSFQSWFVFWIVSTFNAAS